MEYSKIIKEKIGIEFEGLKRGEKFIKFFSQELNNLKIKNNGKFEKLLLTDFEQILMFESIGFDLKQSAEFYKNIIQGICEYKFFKPNLEYKLYDPKIIMDDYNDIKKAMVSIFFLNF